MPSGCFFRFYANATVSLAEPLMLIVFDWFITTVTARRQSSKALGILGHFLSYPGPM